MTHQTLMFRPARKRDVVVLAGMLANDPLGNQRERFEDPLPDTYYAAFEAINSDPNNELVVACFGAKVVGMFQLTFIPYLTYQGGWRALIEGVRVSTSVRSQGIGRQMFEWAIDRARSRNCHLVQLTTDKTRPDALKFYESLGFRASHEGMKLHLKKGSAYLSGS